MSVIEASLRLEIAQYQAAFAKARGEIDRLKAKAKTTGSNLGNDLFGPLKGAVGVLGIGYLGKQALDAVVSMDRLTRGMTTLEGSADGAKARLESLRIAARLPGLDFEQAVQGDIRLRSVGLSADLSRRALIEMGNAIANAGGTASQLDNVTLALTQIVSRGKVTADNINQIANAVPQLRAVMKDVFGTADSEALQKMNISAERFVELTVEGFGKLKRATAGLDEDMTDIGSSLREIMDNAAGPFIREMIPALREMATAAANNKDEFRQLGGELALVGKFGIDVAKGIYGAWKFLGDSFGDFYFGEEQYRQMLAMNEAARQQAEEVERIAQANEKARAAAAGPDPFNGVISGNAGSGGEAGGGKAKDPFKQAEEVAKKQEKAAALAKQIAEDAMTREERIAAVKQELAEATAAEQRAREHGTPDGVVDLELKRLEIQRELNKLLRDEEAERAKIAEEGQAMLDKELEEEDKQNAAKRSLADQIALLQAKATGNDALVEKMERELKIRERAKEIQEQTGLLAEQARRAAEQMIALEERAAKKSSNEDPASSDKPGHIYGVRNRRYMQSGIDEFRRRQGTVLGSDGGLAGRGGHHRNGPLADTDLSLTDRARRNADSADARDGRDTGALDLGGKIYELLARTLE